MNIRVLGCFGSDFYSKAGGHEKRYNPSSFLINDTIALDAGALCGTLTLSELMAIRYVLLTHSHLDHIQSLPFLAETLFGKITAPIVILGIKEVIDNLKRHLFNNLIWPDFTRLPTKEHPILRYQTITADKPLMLSNVKITPIRVNHVVPAVGFIIEDDRTAIVFSGDTGKTDEIWKRAADHPYLKAAFIETSFPNRLLPLAKISGHLTPQLAYEEFKKIGRPSLPFYAYHIKALYLSEIQKELKAIKKASPLYDGQELTF